MGLENGSKSAAGEARCEKTPSLTLRVRSGIACATEAHPVCIRRTSGVWPGLVRASLPVRAESNAAIRLQRECATIAEEVEESMEQVIVKNPAVLSGEPVFRGTRVPFKALTDYLEGGESLSEFLEQYPSVTREAAIAALEEARDSLVAHLQ